MDLYQQYEGNMMGAILDVGFPKSGVHNSTAGIEFAKHVKSSNPNLPLLVQSSQQDAKFKEICTELGASYVDKTAASLVSATAPSAL